MTSLTSRLRRIEAAAPDVGELAVLLFASGQAVPIDAAAAWRRRHPGVPLPRIVVCIERQGGLDASEATP